MPDCRLPQSRDPASTTSAQRSIPTLKLDSLLGVGSPDGSWSDFDSMLSDVGYRLVGIDQHRSYRGPELVDLSRSKAFGELVVCCLRVGTAPPGSPNSFPGQGDVNRAAVRCTRRSLDQPLFFNAIEVASDGSAVHTKKLGKLCRRRSLVVMDSAEYCVGTTRNSHCPKALFEILLHGSGEPGYPKACAVLNRVLVIHESVSLVPGELHDMVNN